ncbi:MAG: metallophosphoesterase family protein [Myxococcales bacterium]|nr:metallophosphoesterase family protein [Myxococcales bacterium]
MTYRIAAKLAVLSMLGLAPARALAAPTFVRLSVIGDSATQIGVAWTTLTGTPEATVEYGTTSGSYTKTATGTVESNISATLGHTSVATLSGLSPNTTYFYRVGGAQGGFSKEYTFRTGPTVNAKCGTYRFAYAGDSRAEAWEQANGAAVKWPLIAGKLVSYKPHFVLHGGDIVYDGNQQGQWVAMLTKSDPFIGQVPFMWSIGNHDDGPGEGDGANFNRIFHLPRSAQALGGSGTEDFYAFKYGNGIFIALATDSYKGGATPFANQAAWLDKLLTQNPATWKVVYLHKPVYTQYLFINHKPNEENQNQAFVPVFNKHHVDIVIGSHNHFYERFAPSACQNGGSDVPCPVSGFDKGTVFMTSGGGGAFPVFVSGGVDAVRVATSGVHHFLLFDVVNNKLDMQVLDENGAMVDKFSITKAFTGPDPCAAPPDGGGPAQDGATAADGATADSATPAKDSATPTSDGPAASKDSTAPTSDSAATSKDSGSTGSNNSSSGCCRVAGGHDAPTATTLLLLACALLWWVRRQRRR